MRTVFKAGPLRPDVRVEINMDPVGAAIYSESDAASLTEPKRLLAHFLRAGVSVRVDGEDVLYDVPVSELIVRAIMAEGGDLRALLETLEPFPDQSGAPLNG